MAWKLNNAVIRAGRAWTGTDGIQHPGNWMIWSDSEKTAAGLVWENDPAPFDSRFYWSAGNAKALADVNATDDDGNALLDADGNQVVIRGLKYNAKQQTKETAASLLANTDWQVIKATEVSTYTVPSTITTYRAAVRTASNTIETAIDNASDIDAFIALYDVPVDSDGNPTGNAPINDWPDEV